MDHNPGRSGPNLRGDPSPRTYEPHWFSRATQNTNEDGAEGLVGLAGPTIYGTTYSGGPGGGGTIFRVDPTGSNFQTIFAFAFQRTNGGQHAGRGVRQWGHKCTQPRFYKVQKPF